MAKPVSHADRFVCAALALGLAFLGFAAPARAAALGPRVARVKALIERAAHAVAPDSRIELGSMRALRAMSACPAPPRVVMMGRGLYRDARVSCASAGWQLYVPVTMRTAQKVVVAAHDLGAGRALKARDLRLVPARFVSGEAQYDAHALAAVIGRALAAPVGAGQPIALASLQGATMVRAGQEISVRVESRSVELKTMAVALQDGRIGQSILVKNPDSGRRYRVDVTGRGAVDRIEW